MATIDNTSTKVITGVARLSYVHVFEPQADDNGNDKYSVSILIPKSDKATVAKIEAAIENAKKLAPAKQIKLPSNCKTPLRDGDVDREDDPAYAGHWFINASSRNKPGVAKPIGKTPDGRPKFEEITDSTEVYSGCYGKVSLNFYPYEAKGNKGIAAGLNNLVKTMDGEYLGGRSSLRDEFAEEDFDDIVDISDDNFLN